MPTRIPALCLAIAAIVVAGCGKTMGEDDCRSVASSMREVWSSEAQKVADPAAPGADRAQGVIKSEGDKLVADWLAECQQELQGRRVDSKEMDCLLAAKTVQAIHDCASR